MRVLEADPSISYKMGKNKKHRIRKSKENEAEESSEDGTGCPHVSKAVNMAAMRKVVQKPTVTLGECSGCVKDPPKTTSRDLFGGLIEGPVAAEGDDAEAVETTICICLQCGHQGCDRNSVNKHALKHYKTPHSGMHCIIVNLTTWSTWCYICDEEVAVNPRLQACIDFLQKQSGISKPEPISIPGRSSDSPVAEAAPALVNTPTSKNASPMSCVKVKGLSNLGNTCFFNAVMQSLCQTRGLESLLLDRGKQGRVCTIPGPEASMDSDSCSSDDDREEEIADKLKPLPNIQTTYGEPGPITLALLNLVQEMKGGTTRNGTVNPTALFTQVCKKAPRFKGFQQQDSHELLRYLVDCIRTEEIKRGQASILKFFKLPETVSPKKVDEETKVKVKEYGRQVKHTFLDSLFGGQLVSTVRCEECKNVSQIYEAYLDLSLPVTEEKPQRPNLILIGKKKDSVSLADAVDEADAAVAAVSDMGLDGVSEKTSKYQERKNKRMAKKEAKKKSKLQKSRSTEHHESGGKGDHEDKSGHQEDAGSEDSNKNDNENESTSADKDKVGQRCEKQDGRGDADGGDRMVGPSGRVKYKQDLTRQDSGRSSRTADSSPEGSKDGLEPLEDEDRDDPSDADVEDNIESDMSRLDLSTIDTSSCPHPSSDQQESVTVEHGQSVSLPGAQQTAVTSGSTSECLQSSVALNNIQSKDNIAVDSKHDLRKADVNGNTDSILKDSASKCEVDVSYTISQHNGLNVSVNGDCHDAAVNSVADDEQEASIYQLCDGVDKLQVTELSGVDGASISCEVSVNNSEVVQLSNGLCRLTVEEVNNENCKVSQNQHVQDIKTVCDSQKISDPVRVNGCEETSEVSATFHMTLPSSAVTEKATLGEEGGVWSQSSHMDHKTIDNGKTETEVQIAVTDDRQHAHQNVLKTRQECLKEARNHSMSTLAPRYHPSPKECSILSCLNQFTAAELLTGSNKVGCKECTRRRRKNSHPHKEKKGKDTVYSNANKQYLIFRPPAVLTLHLKRFEQTGLTSRKVNRHVDFPLLLDLAPYCSSLCMGVKEGQSKVLYSLYGVVEHSGRLNGGHYTAYIKVRPGLAAHTQFMYSQPPAACDLLNVYMTRVMKAKEGSPAWHDGLRDKQEGGEIIDKDTEARAEMMVPPGRWFHISDSRVNEVVEAEVLRAQAYLLFYERIF